MKVEIEIPEGKKAEWVNEVLTLVDDKPKDVTERIKTFEDARKELGSDHPLVEEYETITCRCGGLSDDIIAYMKLRIIAESLNEGWNPKLTKEKRYYPWFRVVYGCCNASANGSVSSAYAGYGASDTYAYVGSHLVFKSKELAEYAGKQFKDIWLNYVL